MGILELVRALEEVDKKDDPAIFFGALLMLRLCYPVLCDRVEDLFQQFSEDK